MFAYTWTFSSRLFIVTFILQTLLQSKLWNGTLHKQSENSTAERQKKKHIVKMRNRFLSPVSWFADRIPYTYFSRCRQNSCPSVSSCALLFCPVLSLNGGVDRRQAKKNNHIQNCWNVQISFKTNYFIVWSGQRNEKITNAVVYSF